MGHHIDNKGRFQSDKHPELPPDRIRINMANPRSMRAMFVLAQDYQEIDHELSNDIVRRLLNLYSDEEIVRWCSDLYGTGNIRNMRRAYKCEEGP